MEIYLIKCGDGALRPVNEVEAEKLRPVKVGQVIKAKAATMRNGGYFRKWFALVRFGYENWDPPNLEHLTYKGQPVQKNFERFRKEVTILAGHFDVVCSYTGDIRKEAKSIAWASMTEDQFAELYSGTIDALLLHFLNGYDSQQLDSIVNQVLSF